MKAYLIRRILIMIPTFLGITLIVFAVLNLAPGRPGAMMQGDAVSDLRSEQSEESVRIFREQFHLDKPVLLNTLFALGREEVERELRILAGLESADPARRLRARERIDEWGGYAVPHLVAVMRDADLAGETALRDLAALMLRRAAQRPLVDPFAAHPDPELRALNREIDAENAYLRQLVFEPDAPEARKRAVIDELQSWYAEHRDRWDWDGREKLRILLLDTRFAAYWRNLVHLDFGVSLVTREPVLDTLVSKLPYSLTLSVGSLLLAYLIAIPIGIFSAVAKDTPADRAVTIVLFMLYSLPSFFVATLLLYFFSYGSDHEALRIFPTGGFRSPDPLALTSLEQLGDLAHHLVLPMFCVTYGSLASLSRYMRTGLLDVIRSDYVRTARAKGLPEWQVIGKHALRNGLLPILTLLAGLLPAALGGAVIIEYIFGIPGMGQWIVESIYARDYNAIMVVQLFSTISGVTRR